MGIPKPFFLLLTCHLLLLKAHSKCQKSFPCNNYTLQFPFTDITQPECGLLLVDCDPQHEHPRIQIESEPFKRYIDILDKKSETKFLVEDLFLQTLLDNKPCIYPPSNMTLSNSPSLSFSFSHNLTLFTCFSNNHSQPIEKHFKEYLKQECGFFNVYYTDHGEKSGVIPSGCYMVQLPKSDVKNSSDLFDRLGATFVVEWSVSAACLKCYRGGGQCLTHHPQNKFYCKKDKSHLKLILASCIASGTGVVLLLSITYIILLRKKNSSCGYLRSRNISSSRSDVRSRNISSSRSDVEGGIFYFGIPVFSYTELEEATKNFNPSHELGSGAFGTVYYGKLWDGREVAIKRLYEHNFKRVEQFLNEIKILTALRHPNLVSLYGCTSRTSRELLLVYEYVQNGTVADHLHGERAKESPLTWPIRLNIAIETATALAYLHKSDIIHRDVKTNNILLDINYSVKVADFGLSRLFPEDVTHISTAPQGTPGYVDPEYYQCYQLTDKSDVYSLGVLLIELVSSMTAVDVNRQKHEINLAILALDRIQRCAFDELIDSSLGYDSDPEVTRMTTTVAELAFRCLQANKDLRPSMDEVVDFLRNILGGEDCKFEQRKVIENIPPSPETDDVSLFKNQDFQPSPVVTDTWTTSSSTS